MSHNIDVINRIGELRRHSWHICNVVAQLLNYPALRNSSESPDHRAACCEGVTGRLVLFTLPHFLETRLTPTWGQRFSCQANSSGFFSEKRHGVTTGTITDVELEEEKRRDGGLMKGERWRDRGGVMRWLTLTLLPASPVASWVFILWRRLRSPLI